MKRSLMVVLAVGLATTGCASKATVDALDKRVTVLETDQKATHDKLQALLVWINPHAPPAKQDGVYDWMGFVHAKVFPGGPGDPIKPSSPPPPF